MPEILQSPGAGVALFLIAFVVGALMGAVGVGGVLLIPALVWLGGQGMHAASGTVLLSLVFTGLYGALLHRHNGGFDWRRTVPVCLCALLLSIPGVWVAYQLSPATLTTVVAVVIVLVGVNVLLGRHQSVRARPTSPGHSEVAGLCGIGAVSGFGSGLSGAGGPLFSVPIMMLLGYPPLVAVGISQVLQVVAASAGALAHFGLGTVDLGLAAALTLIEIAGVHAGAGYARKAAAPRLRALAGSACVLVGCATFYSVL